MNKNCNQCGSFKISELLDFGLQPIVHHYLNSQGEPEEQYPFAMCFCKDCGLVQIVEPIAPEILYKNYITLSSWKSQPHIPHVIKALKKFPQFTKHSKIIEIGSNDGIFLKALKEEGFDSMLGIEPAEDARNSALSNGIESLGIFFNSKTADEIVKTRGKFDIFLSRQNLEHIQDLKDFGLGINKILNPGALVLIEVPNFGMNLNGPDYAFWEEHMNYFTNESLTSYLASVGVKVRHSEIILFSGEALMVIGEYVGVDNVSPDYSYVNELVARIESFKTNWESYKKDINEKLKKFKKADKKIALYGAGARATNFINFCEIGSLLECIVDDQPEKQNKFLPGSRLPICGSENLNSLGIDLCLLAVNAENEEKVISKHAKFLNNNGKFTSVFTPSSKLFDAW